MNNRVNRSRFAKLKLQWEGKVRAAAAFKGIMDYENWAMGASQPLQPPLNNPLDGFMDEIDKTGEQAFEGMTPEEMFTAELEFWADKPPIPKTEKEKLYAQAVEIRGQIDDAIAVEDYEKADILQKTLDVIEIKYNKL